MTRLQRLFSWIRGHVIVADSIITALLALFMFGLGNNIEFNPGLLYNYPAQVQMVWSIALLVPLITRRRWPQISALAFVVLVLLHLLFGPCMLITDFFATFMLYSVILYGNPHNSKVFIVLAFAVDGLASIIMGWAMTVGPILAVGTGQFSAVDATVLNGLSSCNTVYSGRGLSNDCTDTILQYMVMMFVAIALCLASTIIIAYWQRARLMTVRMMQERNDAIAAREVEERNIAALAERARIARDMHDVVAHTLSIIIVQSDGGRYAGANDPVVARSTMETIRHESEHALHDMTRLLGVFGGSPHADYADIDALIAQARTVAPDTVITREIIGDARPDMLGDRTSVAIYHVMQESLTNIRKYAGPKVTVHVTESWDDGTLTVTVTDSGRGASAGLDGHAPGYGLTGMRERIEAVGGSVTFGPRIGGGFAVCATVPFATNASAMSSHSSCKDAHAASMAIDGLPADAPAMRLSEYGTSGEARTILSPKLPTLPSQSAVQADRPGHRYLRTSVQLGGAAFAMDATALRLGGHHRHGAAHHDVRLGVDQPVLLRHGPGAATISHADRHGTAAVMHAKEIPGKLRADHSHTLHVATDRFRTHRSCQYRGLDERIACGGTVRKGKSVALDRTRLHHQCSLGRREGHAVAA